ncbi:MAG: hypothetical protein ACRD1X_13520 [Vicinamibacteria bacterium]
MSEEKGLQTIEDAPKSATGGRRLAVDRRDKVDFYDYRSAHAAAGVALGIPGLEQMLGTTDPIDEADAYVAWSPRNASTCAEGPWEDWVRLAMSILYGRQTATDSSLSAVTPPDRRGYRINNVFVELGNLGDDWWVGGGAYGTWEEWEQLARRILRLEP